MSESGLPSICGRASDARRRKALHTVMGCAWVLGSMLVAGVSVWDGALGSVAVHAAPCTAPAAPAGLRFLVGGPPGDPVTPAPSTPSPCVSTPVRVMTWNIHHGRDINNAPAVPAQVQFMAAQNPQIIILQEVSTWDQQQTQIPTLLQQATGVTWASVFAPSEPCLKGGGCIGELILTRLPMLNQSMTYLPPSSAARAQVNVGGVPVQVFAVHLEAFDTNLRTTQLNQFMTWARSYGGPALVGGDFNSWWGESWIAQMTTEYYDTWRQITGSNQNGHTIGNVRFDYIFRSMAAGERVTAVSCWVGNTTLSDHKPVLADFRVQ
jgi:endonuclease/exonuclease/phosphatase family metal-dependent hydrolase